MGALRSRARMNAARVLPIRGSSSKAGSNHVASVADANGNGVSAHSPTPAPPLREERLQRILEMVESGKPCTIQALAQEFNLSHSRLQHLFKQQTGISLGHLLTQQRLYRAAHLLTHSNKRIKEIAHAVGYEHASSFIRAFERHFAKAPRLFRQTQNGKAS
ncbi:MAG TPA: helix-turn-helix transcriptional regulator [Terriglobales bacterium]